MNCFSEEKWEGGGGEGSYRAVNLKQQIKKKYTRKNYEHQEIASCFQIKLTLAISFEG